MKFRYGLLSLLVLHLDAGAATRYVNLNNATPTAPFTTWHTAATDIQAAVNVSSNGDVILVTNGVYQTGGQLIPGTGLSNRLAVTRAVTVQSVNGPTVTVIKGNQVAGTTNGNAAVRCVYLTNGAFLSGFTLTNGATRNTGVAADLRGGGVWCVSTNAAISNCVVVGSAAFNGGGGTFQGTLTDCRLAKNNAGVGHGGGALLGVLRNCTLEYNQARFGGGVASNILYACTLMGNAASDGGGAYQAVLRNCTVAHNSADNGGGAHSSRLGNCVITQNSAYSGGGAFSATLTNCTVTGNSAQFGGGTQSATLYNSIVYFNTAASGPNYESSTFNYSCTLPRPSGSSNLDQNPQLSSPSHLSATSPCRSAGSTNYTSGTDIDGETWLSPPAMGCDAYKVGSVTGTLSAKVLASFTNVATGFPLTLTANIEGRTSASVWDFGDGTIVSNRPYASHAWSNPGSYTVILSAFNEDHPEGTNATLVINVLSQPVHYVAASNSIPVAPYDSWETAATNIQDAVDATTTAGALILVTNGVYQNGGRAVYGKLTNRVVLNKSVILQSVNGPQLTIIQGKQAAGTKTGPDAVRCVYLSNGGILSGFMLTKGATRQTVTFSNDRTESGGGLWCASADVVITNCLLVDNAAFLRGGGAYFGTFVDCTFSNNTALHGGGVYLGTLNNSSLINNSATSEGGGANGGDFTNCVLRGNSAPLGGGTSGGTFSHCTLSSNTASLHGGGAKAGTFYNCNFIGNSASSGGGGGTYGGLLFRCTLTGNSAAGGGGADSAKLYDCVLTGNTARVRGGGAAYSTMNNCTLTGNSAGNQAGGFIYGNGVNSIVYFNSAPINPNWYQGTPGVAVGGALNNSCTTPLPIIGERNITNAPLFVDYDGGDFHLSSNSPCINAGSASGFTAIDRDGNPRPVAGTPDIGAFEFQTPTSVLSYAWAQQFGLPVDGSADYADADDDDFNNWQEWRANTVPTDPASVLKILSISRGTAGTSLTWQSVTGMTYYVERSSAYLTGFVRLHDNIASQGATTSYTNYISIGSSPVFYRVGVR